MNKPEKKEAKKVKSIWKNKVKAKLTPGVLDLILLKKIYEVASGQYKEKHNKRGRG